MSIQDEVDRLIDERPGRELLAFHYDDPAVPVHDLVHRSGGSTAAYMIVTDGGRVIVNTGLGYEAPHHKRVFDQVLPGPTPYIVTTQGHVDHVGGVARFREADTRYVAQAANPTCQADDARIARFRYATAGIWFDVTGAAVATIAEANPGVPMDQDRPTPDVTFEDHLSLEVGGLELELISMPGGETVDSCVVWLPQHGVCLISNLLGPLFPHFPNFNTLRGDRYRFAEPYLANVRALRALRPEVLITGRHLPITGANLIDASLARLHDAVEHVHRSTVDGMNEGRDLLTLMREIRLPDELRVGQGYGKVTWAVRTIWESYTGWFQRRSTTELYPVDPLDAFAELVEMVGGDAVLERSRARLVDGDPVGAIHLAEAVLHQAPRHPEAAAVMVAAHEALLAGGGDESFWEHGWLRYQVEQWSEVAVGGG